MDSLRSTHATAMKILYNLPRARKEYIQAFEEGSLLLTQAGILTTPRRMGHFLAQVIVESDGLAYAREDMDYSPKRLVEVFGVGQHSANVTQAEAREIGHCPTIIAERVYGKGNPPFSKKLGNVYAGDGWQFRGGGLIQLTGRANYQMVADATKTDFVRHPDWVSQSSYALIPPCWFWGLRNVNEWCDRNDIGMVTRRVNGGEVGLINRITWFNLFCTEEPMAGPPIYSKHYLPRSPANLHFYKWFQKVSNFLVQHHPKGTGIAPIVEDGIYGERSLQQYKSVQRLYNISDYILEFQESANAMYALFKHVKEEES